MEQSELFISIISHIFSLLKTPQWLLYTHCHGSEWSGPNQPLLYPFCTLSQGLSHFRLLHLFCLEKYGKFILILQGSAPLPLHWQLSSHHPCHLFFVTWPSLFTLIALGMVSIDIQTDGNFVFPVVWAPNLGIILGSPCLLYTTFNPPGNTLMALTWKCRHSDHFPPPSVLPLCLGLSHYHLSLGYRITTT